MNSRLWLTTWILECPNLLKCCSSVCSAGLSLRVSARCALVFVSSLVSVQLLYFHFLTDCRSWLSLSPLHIWFSATTLIVASNFASGYLLFLFYQIKLFPEDKRLFHVCFFGGTLAIWEYQKISLLPNTGLRLLQKYSRRKKIFDNPHFSYFPI